MIRKRVHTEQGDLRVFANATEQASIRADSAFGVDSVLPSRWCQPRSVIAAAQGAERRRPLGNGVVHADGPGNLRDSESWRPTRGCAWGEHCRRSPVSFGRLAREGARTAGWPQRCTPGSAFTESPENAVSAALVAVRGIADGVHRPPQLCTPTVVTVHTDRPCSTDARSLCVR